MDDYVEFVEKDLLLNSDDPELPYRRRKNEEKVSLHFGQRKLLLTVVQFLTLFWNPKKVPKPIVVYAGAAPGNNIEIISQLFPEVEFHLYDPWTFKINETDKIHLYNQYFTDHDAKQWSGRSDIYFISDIRTADYTKAKNLDENENQIMQDMMKQMNWYNIINPIHGHLKFRLPYTGGNRPPKVNYLNGHVFKQALAPKTSTETRLVPLSPNNNIDWDCNKYQSQLFYHNVEIREKIKYINPLNPNEPHSHIDNLELLNDYDSRAETHILMNYIYKKTGKVEPIFVKSLSRLLTSKLLANKKHKQANLQFLRSKPCYVNSSRDNLDENLFIKRPESKIMPHLIKSLATNNSLKKEKLTKKITKPPTNMYVISSLSKLSVKIGL